MGKKKICDLDTFWRLIKTGQQATPLLPSLGKQKAVDYKGCMEGEIKSRAKGLWKYNVQFENKECLLWLGRGLCSILKKENSHISCRLRWPAGGNRKGMAGLPLPALWFRPRNSTLAGEGRLSLTKRGPNHSFSCHIIWHSALYMYFSSFLPARFFWPLTTWQNYLKLQANPQLIFMGHFPVPILDRVLGPHSPNLSDKLPTPIPCW